MPLEFSELFHKSALTNNGTRFKVPGVYIWGFVYHKVGDKIGDPVNFTGVVNPIADPEKQVFIPYYVGIARNKMTVLSRLSRHLQFRIDDSNKRTRIKVGEIPSTLSNDHFPLNPRGNDQNRISNNTTRFLNYIQNPNYPNDISYFNDANVLNLLYNNTNTLFPQNTDYPIQNQIIGGNKLIPDSLNTLSSNIPCISTGQCYDNFFFCFYEQKGNEVSFDPFKLTLLEAVCVLMLKGKTLGQFQNLQAALELIADPNFVIMDNTKFDVFKQHNQKLIDANGPFELGNIAFPGYL
jgi:hypothetical protein